MQPAPRRPIGSILVVVLASAALVAATFLPYRWLDRHGPAGTVFSGLSTHVPDEASYLMWMEQHAAGHVRVVNRMTTEPHDPFPGNPAWMAVAWGGRLAGLSGADAYHAGRAGLAFLYLLVLAWAFRRLLPDGRAAALAWALAATGGGLSWLDDLGVPLASADAWMPELWSFPSILHFPHFALALLLVALCLGLLAPSLATARRLPGVGAGLALALLVHVHPYTAVALSAGLAVAWAAGLMAGRFPAISGGWARNNGDCPRIGGPLPVTLALAAVSFAVAAAGVAESPMLQAWAAQNVMPSPPPWEYVAGLGLPGLLAVAGVVRLTRARAWTPAAALLAAWAGTAFAMAYAAPVIPFERRCLEGVHLAVAAFAALALAPALARASRPAALALGTAVAVACAPASLAAGLRECTPANPGHVDDDWPAMYRSVRDLAGDDGVLAPPRHSLFLAAFAGARVHAAHHEVTPDFGHRLRRVESFFAQPMPPDARLFLLAEARCRWVVIDVPTAKAVLGPGIAGALVPRANGRTWVLYGPPP